MKQRSILHIDLDCFYASVEMMLNPQLKGKCVAVVGDPEKRHGIVLAKSYEAKAYGVKTAEPIWEAKQKCPSLILVPARFFKYIEYSQKVRQIFLRYSDELESFGLDECWLDITGSLSYFKMSAYEIAQKIQQEVMDELALSCSIGISWNKVIAKFASDYKKPYGIVEVNHDNFEEIFWQAPIEELLYVGHKTKIKYNKWGMYTIGDLAKDTHFIKNFGYKVDRILQTWAQGYDDTKVHGMFEEAILEKSIGNSMTTPKDMQSMQDVSIVMWTLAESIGIRLRNKQRQGKVIAITLRDSALQSFTRRFTLSYATNITEEIHREAMALVKANYNFALQPALRSVGISVSGLNKEKAFAQYDIFNEEQQRKKKRDLDHTIDCIRDKYGYFKVQRCVSLLDDDFGKHNLAKDHVIFPEAVFKQTN